MSDRFNLERFTSAQAPVYEAVISELRHGRKTGHWMWFVFPQVAGLGGSWMSQEYAISSRAEAEAYLAHPILGPRLIECTRLVISADRSSIHEILGSVDALKFRSCMTLFSEVAKDPGVFREALERYFEGDPDQLTLDRI
jgi:uncharacterized protein (DUF1810 family)